MEPPLLPLARTFPTLLGLLLLGGSAGAQLASTTSHSPAPTSFSLACRPVHPQGGWYSGDTHDHIQECSQVVHSDEVTLTQMRNLSLDVSSLLIWNPGGTGSLIPFTQYVCSVTGVPISGTGSRVIQYGVETSGLNASTWGHLSGLNISSPEARIAKATNIDDCYSSVTGLGLGCGGGDGTGLFSAPIAKHFASAPKALRGYAHQAWPTALYSTLGYDWNTKLLGSGFTTDAVCLDNGQKLAFPLIFETGLNRRVYPALGAMDVALGNVEFLETGDMDFDYTFGDPNWPAAQWWGAFYRLLNAGLRVVPSAGRDTTCEPAGSQQLGTPRTWCQVTGPLTYDGWTQALGEGKASLSMGNTLFLDMKVNTVGIGGLVNVTSPTNTVSAEVTIQSTCDDHFRIEVLRNGVVAVSQSVIMAPNTESKTVTLQVPVTKSCWIAARLTRAKRNVAHTGASYVILDDEPIANCEDAEYWMMWCDRVSKEIADFPGLHFGCQDAEVLADVADAREVFKTLRDYDFYNGGFDPAWGVTRIGSSTPACRGPITIGINDAPLAGSQFSFTCVNAPPKASGLLYVSTSPQAGVCVSNVALWMNQSTLVTPPIPATSYASGAAETPVNPTIMGLPMGTTLYVQYVWTNTPACPGLGCDQLGSALSASDALVLTLQ